MSTTQEKDAEYDAEDADSEAAGAETGTNSETAGGEARLDYQAECEVLKDKYVRLMAEFENFRRRTAKEQFEMVSSANARLLARLTEVLDNFELAFDPRHKVEKLEDFEKGIRLIYSKFKGIVEDEGLEEVNPKGAAFDPNVHEALMQQPSDSVAEGHVAEVMQRGYKLKGKVLKHAKVVVSTGKGNHNG
jgi:molecular chaperone GrpE